LNTAHIVQFVKAPTESSPVKKKEGEDEEEDAKLEEYC
jgi:hypothetical protein